MPLGTFPQLCGTAVGSFSRYNFHSVTRYNSYYDHQNLGGSDDVQIVTMGRRKVASFVEREK